MGCVLIIKDGLETELIPECQREAAILEFFNMKSQAEDRRHRFMIDAAVFEHTYSYGAFYPGFVNLTYDSFRTIPSLKGVGQTAAQMFQDYWMQCPNPQICERDFHGLELPRTLSGFNNGCCDSDYIFDEWTFVKWENAWFTENPDKIEWPESSNEFMPRLDLTERILIREFDSHKDRKEVKELVQRNYSIPHIFHEGIVAHKGQEMTAYFTKLAHEVLSANYYKYEASLSKKEQDYMGKPRSIYSLVTKSGKMHFVSLDCAHGMFEICNDKGVHIGEYRIDGSFNSDATPETHSLRCVRDWLKCKN